MEKYYLYLLAMAGLLALMLVLPVLVRVYVSRSSGGEEFWLEVELWPHIKVRLFANMKVRSMKSKRPWRDSYTALKFIRPVLKYMASHTNIVSLRWQTTLGTGDAYYTGLLTGFLWGAKSIAVKIFNSIFAGCPPVPDIKVIPAFNKKEFGMTLDCILKTRIGYIMVTGFKLMALKLKSIAVKRLTNKFRVNVTESEWR